MSRATSKGLKLGDLMVRQGLLTIDGLQKALMAQQQGTDYRPLGQICVDLKLISKLDLQRFLSKHHKRIQIGELMLNMGLINQTQLQHVLEQQRYSGLRFGALLVKSGLIDENQLIKALSLQLDIPRVYPSAELIDLDLLKEVDEIFLREHICLPMHKHSNQMVVVMSDPLNTDLLMLLVDRFKCKIMPAIAPSSEILDTLGVLYAPQVKSRFNADLGEELQRLSRQDKHTKEQVMPIAQYLMRRAVEAGATAMHLETQERYIRVRFRVEGLLQHSTDLPLHLGPLLIDCIKTPFRIKRENYWEERISTELAKKRVELSISFFQGLWGETLMMRISYLPSHLLGIDNLWLSPSNLAHIQQHLAQAGGILLAASPVRSGKSTFLYACLNEINQQHRSILTLEEAVNYPLPGIVQNHYKPGCKDSYESLIQAMIDSDSDVLLVGEIKNQATAQLLNEATLYGKKVFSALHASDTQTALHRLIGLGARELLSTPVPFLLLGQRLIRQLCEYCKSPYMPSEDELAAFHLLPVDRGHYAFSQVVGCAKCDGHGYRGMIPVHEVLRFNESLRESIVRGDSAVEIRQQARMQGLLLSMREDGLYKSALGLTSLEEIKRIAIPYETDLARKYTVREVMAACQDRH